MPNFRITLKIEELDALDDLLDLVQDLDPEFLHRLDVKTLDAIRVMVWNANETALQYREKYGNPEEDSETSGI